MKFASCGSQIDIAVILKMLQLMLLLEMLMLLPVYICCYLLPSFDMLLLLPDSGSVAVASTFVYVAVSLDML